MKRQRNTTQKKEQTIITEFQTNKQTKYSAQISPYTTLTQTTGPPWEGRNQKEERI